MNELDLFSGALERSPEERSAYLNHACGADPEIRRRVEELLRQHDRTVDYFDRPAAEFLDTAEDAMEAGVGTRINGYELRQLLGEGGMGSVFLAEQSEPVHRMVALKLIRRGRNNQQVIARFEAERQALAMMDHVNIARVLDLGSTESGRPYLVMEYISGEPMTSWCDDNRLTPRERLQLFVPVCQAIQHAHQKGIIHRDIKPSNVMVTLYDGRPVPKVIDFGVAKATDPTLPPHSLMTQPGAMVGTLQYMSPEQANMSDRGIDTRSDIYSLGVLLYELLTGSTPLGSGSLIEVGYAEVLRRLQEDEPLRPSARLGDSGASLPAIAARRHLDPSALFRVLHGELDWIVMKALEKDRNRRYESASGLAADLQRYLRGEAVLAAPPSTGYRFKKFVSRHRGSVLAGLALVCTLIIGITGMTMAWYEQSRLRAEAERHEHEANTLAEVAGAVSLFQAQMFRAPERFTSGDKVTVLEVMTEAVKELEAGRLKHQPVAEANVAEMIGLTMHSLGRYAEAEPLLRMALARRRSSFGDTHPGVAQSMDVLARTLHEVGQREESLALLRSAIEIRRAVLSADHPDLISSLASMGAFLEEAGNYEEAESLCREALEADRRVLPAGHLDIADDLDKLGWVLQAEDKFAEAEGLARESLAIRRQHLPPTHRDMCQSLNVLAVVLARSGRLSEAEPLFREMLEIDRKSLPADHPRFGQDLNNLATALQEQGKFAEAEPIQREGLEFRIRTLPAGHPAIAQSMKNLAVLLLEQRRFADAEPLAREALAIRRTAMPAGHPDTAGSLQTLGSILQHLGQFADGEAALLEAEGMLAAAPGGGGENHAQCVTALVDLYAAWNVADPNGNHSRAADLWRSRLPAAGTGSGRPQ